MRASRETARAARQQTGQAIDLIDGLHDKSDREITVARLESLVKVLQSVNRFIDAAERVLPSESDYAGKANKKREPLPAA